MMEHKLRFTVPSEEQKAIRQKLSEETHEGYWNCILALEKTDYDYEAAKKWLSTTPRDEKKELVFNLRKATGYGLMDCKQALQESDYDIEKAKQWLLDNMKRPFKFVTYGVQS